ncbi:penicillin-binding protein [Saccharothrix sp. ALI-22-I]|uniref:serine hydrolase domain-containing protein n=1 Tax=Saccharothrix sp. ALI-22-I TaxID=1933778 RepID=UPI00097C36C6|nr:serine hydrolase domain-containing protein [Saccharothrix sp. ALI-22-I]ONI80332.1 penicillin-binding protein [Saccharothrix sp. ALI-22-I]
MTFQRDHWQARLDELRAANHVPGATLAVLVDGEIHEFATGVLNRGTGVEATADSVFQLGSVAKIYTATLIMQLVEAGLLDLDAPVRDVLPDFTVADAEASRTITPRQLLSHTSGLSGDFHLDTGRGDDCIARYVEGCADLAQDCPPGTTVSYSGSGYVVLGRIAEVLTGMTWDQALKERVLAPLGLDHTMMLPEDLLRFRSAMGHLGEPGQDPDPAPVWEMMPRGFGPGAIVCASAADVVRLAKAHLDGGASVLTPAGVAAMQERQVDVPDKWTVSADGWGLGWTLYDWDGTPGFGHDGAATGQYAYLRVVPGAGVAVALLTNGGGARPLATALLGELLAETAGVPVPEPFGPREVDADITPHLGTYRREGVVITVGTRSGAPHLRYEFVDGMKAYPSMDMDLLPVTDTVFAASGAGPSFSDAYMPVVFSTLTDGRKCCYIGMRAAPKVA